MPNKNKAYETLVSYVKKNSGNSRFTTNALRNRLSAAGVKPKQMGGLISRAISDNIITRVGTTTSNDPNHNKGTVGVYVRGLSSYYI